jgi:hypothetical protein
VQVLENTRKTLANHGVEPLFCIDMIPRNSMVFGAFISRFLHGLNAFNTALAGAPPKAKAEIRTLVSMTTLSLLFVSLSPHRFYGILNVLHGQLHLLECFPLDQLLERTKEAIQLCLEVYGRKSPKTHLVGVQKVAV